MAEIDDIKHEVTLANRMLVEMELAGGPTIERGHVSFRLPNAPDTFLIKALGPALSLMDESDLMVCNMDGFKVEGRPDQNPPNEVKMHSCIMRANPAVNSVVHVHPRYTVLMSVLQAKLSPMCIEGMPLFAKPIPMFASPRLIIRDEDGVEVTTLLGDHQAILLQGHGAATTGGDMEDAVVNMLHIEEQSRMNYLAYCAVGPDHLSLRPEQAKEFVENMRRMPDQEHLKPELAPTPRKPSGIWDHYSKLVG
jgi:ribulose-5-phosphate 4-epimerase/fuculose-1-phosphate aldolase